MDNELSVTTGQKFLSSVEVKAQMIAVRDILENVLIEGEVKDGKIVKDGHYGKIPGCGNKRVLLKPGAEKLCLAFNLSVKYETNFIEIEENISTPPGHREFKAVCSVYNRATQEFIDEGVGICTTMEKKYRYRMNWDTKKNEENHCIADVYNTVSKMSCKRALVHAVIQALAVGDIFMQDMEELQNQGNGKPKKPDQKPPQSKSDNNTITDGQKRAVWALLEKAQPNSTDQEKNEMSALALGKGSIEDYSQLSKTDASTLIKILKSDENGK